MTGQTSNITYSSYLNCIPLNDIPLTCRDAIRVTYKLGYKYLWIDAFCIIQDDEADKSRELVKMGDIYRYALFTIYAKASSSSQSGLFETIDSHAPCLTPTSATQVTFFDGPDYLEQRGWVLQ